MKKSAGGKPPTRSQQGTISAKIVKQSQPAAVLDSARPTKSQQGTFHAKTPKNYTPTVHKS